MGIDLSYQGSWLVAKITGELDVASVPAVRLSWKKRWLKTAGGLILT